MGEELGSTVDAVAGGVGHDVTLFGVLETGLTKHLAVDVVHVIAFALRANVGQVESIVRVIVDVVNGATRSGIVGLLPIERLAKLTILFEATEFVIKVDGAMFEGLEHRHRVGLIVGIVLISFVMFENEIDRGTSETHAGAGDTTGFVMLF